MKLVTFLYDEDIKPKIGVLSQDHNQIIILEKAVEALEFSVPYFFNDMISFLSGDSEARDKAQEVVEFVQIEQPPDVSVPYDSVTLLSPVPRPESIRDCMAFEEHIINIIRNVGLKKLAGFDRFLEKILGRKRSLAYLLNRAFYERPIYYKGNRFSVVSHNQDVIIPDYTRKMDYELEFGVFLCRSGKNIPVADAAGYIGGYTIFNDFSARDIQLDEQKGRLGPAKGKDFDTGNALGPYLVTPDEIGDPYQLTMTASVNNEIWSRGNSADMHWRFEDMISYMSRSETLYPGEFIGSGTCSGKEGCGCGLEMNRFLKKGDVVELFVEKIGTLKNKVV
ncbi:MAG: fumarylacetoacetate hydrolase family protein [Proteobacteria bacterium]|nr:fumarylacetoacetate hydrolase family protein [Pseudomonadota bacterium]